MSSSKQLTCAVDRNLATIRNKPTIIGLSEQLESIRKLTDSSEYSKTTELNNNCVLVSDEGSGALSAFKMDSKRKQSENKAPTIPQASASSITIRSSDIRSTFDDGSQEEPANQIPSYSSIFTPASSYRSVLQTDQTTQKNANATRGSLRKQVAADLETPVGTINRLPNKKLTAFNCTTPTRNNVSHREEEDEVEDDETDERLPFNSGMTKIRPAKRVSPDSLNRCQSPNRHSIFNYEHRCDLANHQHKLNPQTKISFNDSRLPSFNVCQSSYNHENVANRKVDWLDQPMCYKCDCSKCCKKRKIEMVEGYCETEPQPQKYGRTRVLHLILKSIILVLLTLLLLMLVVGIILASHYLPLMLERVLNVSRSFNVTIAG